MEILSPAHRATGLGLSHGIARFNPRGGSLVKFKDNVTVTFTPTNQAIIRAVDEAHKIFELDDGLCTSGLDGTHLPNSGHYHGRALDFRTPDLNLRKYLELLDYLRELLRKQEGEYLVIPEATHFHVQRQKDSF